MRFFEEVRKEHLKHKEVETILPIRADKGSCGYDLQIKEDIVLKPNERKLTFTDVKAFFPENEVLMIFIRSSLGVKKGINLSNGTGIIDSSYYSNPSNDGNLGIPLINTSENVVELKAGERICQAIFMPYFTTNDDETNGERNGGFGSSGN